jgi:hypothetical protein
MHIYLNKVKARGFGFTEVANSHSVITFELNDAELFDDIISCEEDITLCVHPTLSNNKNNQEYRFHSCSVQAGNQLSLVLFSSYLSIHNINDLRKSKIDNYFK